MSLMVDVENKPVTVQVSFEISDEGLLQIVFYGEGENWLLKRLRRIERFEQGGGFGGQKGGVKQTKVILTEETI